MAARPLRAVAALLAGSAAVKLGASFVAPPQVKAPSLRGVGAPLQQDASSPNVGVGPAGAGAACLAAGAACLLALSRRAGAEAREVRSPEVAMRATAAPKAKAKAKAKGKAKIKAKPPVPLDQQVTEGIFAPVVLGGSAVFGDDFVKKARGKGIGLHSNAINAFCQRFAIPVKKRQGFIKTAKKVGHDLGMLPPGGHFAEAPLKEPAMQLWKDWGIDRW